MLDVHVLTMPETLPEWLAQCRASIAIAAGQAGFPVAVHEIPGERGHLGRGRARGYAMGDHPYVTYVDDDDYLLPIAFAVLSDAMRAGHGAVYGRCVCLQNGVLRSHSGRRALQVHRRDKLIDHTQWAGCGDIVQRKVPGVDVLELGYVYRITVGSAGRALARRDPDEYRRAHA